MLISPLELEDTVRRQLDALEDAAGRSAFGLSGLARRGSGWIWLGHCRKRCAGEGGSRNFQGSGVGLKLGDWHLSAGWEQVGSDGFEWFMANISGFARAAE